ncbi:dephospho-CoA kinase [Coprobacter sp.]
MKSVGITGGIGSGKSVVSHFLHVLGFPVYDSDSEAKRLMNVHSEIRSSLIEMFGSNVYKGEELNKPFLANCIFGDLLLLQKINEIVHPVVRKDFESWCNRQKTNFVFMESAILFESGFETAVDEIWVVTAPKDVRIRRVIDRNKCSTEEVKQRISVQLDDAEKCRKAHYIIRNDDIEPLIPQILNCLNQKT